MTINSERLDGVFVLANRWIGDKSVAAKLTILSSFFMVVLIGIVSYTIITLNQQSTDAEAINVAGRQRMLTQKFTKELFDELNNKQIVAFSERQTTAIATQIMEDRAYYSKNVIVKLREDRSKVFATPNYHNKSKAIPTPATFVQEASNELVKKNADYSYQLLSKFNINAEKGLSTAFSKTAWNSLVDHSASSAIEISKTETGGAMLSYAKADIAGSGCVSCHNGLSSSPKRDFIVGDLMGILVVSMNITGDPDLAEQLVNPPKVKQADKTKELFEISLASLTKGGKTFSDLSMTKEIFLPEAPSQDITNNLAEIEALWKEMMLSVEFLRSTQEMDSSLYVKNIHTVRKMNVEILKKMNLVVGQFASVSSGKVSRMMWIEGIILLFFLVLVALSSYLIGQMILRPLRQAIVASASIAHGDLSKTITVSSKDETGQLLETMNQMQEKLVQVIETDIQSIVDAAKQGDLTGRILLDNKDGFYEKLSCGINELVSVNEGVVNDTQRMFSAMSQGDLSQRITNEYQGAFDELKEDANQTVEKLTQVIEGDIQSLINAAKQGDLSQRIDQSDKSGFFASLSDGINELVQVNEKVVNDTVRMFAALAQGDLSPRITEEYQGAFNTLKLDANKTVDKLTQVIESDIQSIINSAKSGDLTHRISLDDKEGFFETLSGSINELVEVNEKVINDTVHIMSSMAEGDLTHSIDANYQGIFGQLKDDTNNSIGHLTNIISSISSSADMVGSASNELAMGNDDLSARTEQQAASLEETASSMEELASTVKQNAESAEFVNDLVNSAQKSAVKGGEVVDEAIKSMVAINKASREIVNITNVIDEIAFQTNLLALNAAVEAARAGEQGRGFAVVAAEVRNLAQRSASSAKEIKDLIENSVEKVNDGTRLVNESGENLSEIVDSVTKVCDIIGNIASSAREQTAGIDQVNAAVAQMDQMTQQNAALVEEATAASRSMADQAKEMNEEMQFFTIDKNKTSTNKPVKEQIVKKTVCLPPVTKAIRRPSFSTSASDEWEEF